MLCSTTTLNMFQVVLGVSFRLNASLNLASISSLLLALTSVLLLLLINYSHELFKLLWCRHFWTVHVIELLHLFYLVTQRILFCSALFSGKQLFGFMVQKSLSLWRFIIKTFMINLVALSFQIYKLRKTKHCQYIIIIYDLPHAFIDFFKTFFSLPFHILSCQKI